MTTGLSDPGADSIIGVCPYRCINGRELLEHEAKLSKVIGSESETFVHHYDGVARPSASGAPLNPHHTHFLMVDDGKDSGVPWGCELELATEFEKACAAQLAIPICQMLIQGGTGALWCAVRTATAGIPIICLAESGGAASAIYWYFQGGAALVEEHVPTLLRRNPSVRAKLRAAPSCAPTSSPERRSPQILTAVP